MQSHEARQPRSRLIFDVRQSKIPMRDECLVSDASELATAKDSEVCFASDAHFRPFDDCRDFARLESASSVSDSRRLARFRSAGVEFTLGTRLFIQQIFSVVTLFPQPKKFVARSAASLESEPNQTLQPTAATGRG